MDLIQGSETSANYNLTPGKYPKENIQYSNHGESLKSRIHQVAAYIFFLVFPSLQSFLLPLSFNNVLQKAVPTQDVTDRVTFPSFTAGRILLSPLTLINISSFRLHGDIVDSFSSTSCFGRLSTGHHVEDRGYRVTVG